MEFLPVYTPSPEEKAKPELYAKNVQMVMAEALGVPAMDISYAGYYKEYCQKHNTYVEDTKKKQWNTHFLRRFSISLFQFPDPNTRDKYFYYAQSFN